jgi:hypothetical protein
MAGNLVLPGSRTSVAKWSMLVFVFESHHDAGHPDLEALGLALSD